MPVFDSLDALLASGVDAVTITTPPETRRELVLEALAAGVHVVADKPFAPTAEVGLELAAAAESAGVLLSVFHNRRWDADIRTLAAVIDSGRLGELWRVHSRFDLDDPDTLEAGPGGGLLRDLGSHLVDQMVWLLGDVRSVNAHLDWFDLPEGRTDAGFCLELEHTSGVRSQVESSKVNHIEARELRAYGSEGSYRALGHRRPGPGDLRRAPPGRRPRGVGLRGARALGAAVDGSRRGLGAVGAGSLPRPLHGVRCRRPWRGSASRCRRTTASGRSRSSMPPG